MAVPRPGAGVAGLEPAPTRVWKPPLSPLSYTPLWARPERQRYRHTAAPALRIVGVGRLELPNLSVPNRVRWPLRYTPKEGWPRAALFGAQMPAAPVGRGHGRHHRKAVAERMPSRYAHQRRPSTRLPSRLPARSSTPVLRVRGRPPRAAGAPHLLPDASGFANDVQKAAQFNEARSRLAILINGCKHRLAMNAKATGETE